MSMQVVDLTAHRRHALRHVEQAPAGFRAGGGRLQGHGRSCGGGSEGRGAARAV